MKELGELEATLGHRFAHGGLLEQALTHSSVRHEQQTGADTGRPVEDNERLEFLGDAIVGMVVGELLYRRYPELDEGELTRLRAALVSRKHLGLVGTGLHLSRYLRLGRAEDRNGGRKKAVLLANCMEALIGALYLEAGLEIAAAFVRRTVVDPYLAGLRDELRENRSIGDYKTALQELLQSRRAPQPEYLIQAESGPDHHKHFLVEVRIGSGDAEAEEGAHKAWGEGSTKKKAAQEAARKLYERLVGRSTGQPEAAAGSQQPGAPTRPRAAASAGKDPSRGARPRAFARAGRRHPSLAGTLNTGASAGAGAAGADTGVDAGARSATIKPERVP